MYIQLAGRFVLVEDLLDLLEHKGCNIQSSTKLVPFIYPSSAKTETTNPLKRDAVSLDLVHLHQVSPLLTTAHRSWCMMHFPKLSVRRGFHPSDCAGLDVDLSRSRAVKHMLDTSPLEPIRARFKLAQVLVSSSAVPLKMQHLVSVMASTHTQTVLLLF